MSADSPPVSGRYRVLDRLGQGAMGEVWRVEDTLAGEVQRALKRIKPAAGDVGELTLRFQAEFHAMARLDHPNVVAVHDYGLGPDGALYLTMDLVPGEELEAIIGGRPLPAERFYTLFAQLLQALDYVHGRQLLHRDIKSANVRVQPDGLLKLMDFGLVARAGAEAGAGVSGTPGYMAPELLMGRPASLASDLYALGCLAHEMLTGALPFQGGVAQVVRAHLKERPPSLAAARPDLPAALVRLVERLLEKEPAARPRGAGTVLGELAAVAGLEVTKESLAQRQSFLVASELVGRDGELTLLDAALADVAAGRGRGVLVGAPAGTGKSRLMREVILKAQLAGFLVLQGHCRDDGAAPFEAVGASLKPGLAVAPGELAARHRETVEALYPDGLAGGSQGGRATPLDGVLALLSDLSRVRPVLWLLDDLHWADPQTVAMLNAGIRSLGGERVLCLGTFRDDETPAGSPVWQTGEEGASAVIRLGPLSRPGQDALLRALLSDAEVPEPFAEALYRATGGNPLFVQEALRGLIEEAHLTRTGGRWHFPADMGVLEGLRRVESTIRRRLARLTDEARGVLQVAAVLGGRGCLRALAACAGGPEGALFAALSELVERQFLIRDEQGAFVFPHDLVREEAYACLELETRRELHLRAAEVLLAQAGPEVEPLAADLARHFLRGGDDERGYPWALRAARLAFAAGADFVALAHLEEADAALGRLPGDRLEARFPIWLQLGIEGFHLATARASDALARAVAAYDAEPGRVGPLLGAVGLEAADLFSFHARALGLLGKVDEALAFVDRIDAIQPPDDTPRGILSTLSRYMPLLLGGRIDEVVALARRVAVVTERYLPRELPDALSRGRIGTYGIMNAIAFQGLRPDPAMLERALACGAELGDPDPFLPRVFFGIWSAWSGQLQEVEAYIALTLRRSRAIGAPPSPYVLYLQPLLRWQRGEYVEALAELERNLLVHAHLREQALPFNLCLVLRGRLLDALDRPEEARAVFDAVLTEARAWGLGLALLLGLLGKASLLRDEGRVAEGRAGFEEVLALATDGPLRNPYVQAFALLGLGACDTLQGDPRALQRLEASLAIVTRPEVGNRLLEAHCQRGRARALEALGRREEAGRARQEALRLFRAIGLPYWVFQVEQDGRAPQAVAPAAAPEPTVVEARFERFKRLM